VSDIQAVTPDLDALVRLFYREPAELGRFEEVDWHTLARDYRMLLAHDSHMTVTVERFHNGPVDVRVLETNITPTHYARKILLARHSDGVVVQFGIMRLDLSAVSPEVRREIESQRTPLGRILIQHNLLTQVNLRKVFQVTPGADLQGLFGMQPGQVTYGRTAVIHLDSEPAVELLEIVTPL
jgi:chorismate-pyruvate lyase